MFSCKILARKTLLYVTYLAALHTHCKLGLATKLMTAAQAAMEQLQKLGDMG
ncbi:unnamed protein product [Arabidopsis arenosa]|uniref:Uncharacterized protein n=1 Tax=Arabidopsis arenosa TaxID=38785 RepID=A0A8S1ZVM5_ARAAE|nr:unnamed protein product [Arabidopsis arenosa]